MKLSYDEMMNLCNSKDEFRAKVENVDGVDVTIFSYMVAKTDTFDSELAKEFRGTTFRNDTKECICRPFKKFFNINEREETQLQNIDLRNATYYTKFDGSMATPVLINDKVFWKTKNSFYSDVAVKIQNFYDNNRNYKWKTKLRTQLKYFTPIFEYVAPHNRIVLEYKEEELVYLGFRELESGLYTANWNNSCDVEYGDIYGMKDIEGFVIICSDGTMVKAKTEEYLNLHRIVTDFNPKNIIQSTLDETIDDMLGVVYQIGIKDRAKEIEALRDETLETFLKVKDDISYDWCWARVFKEDRKEFALQVNKEIRPEFRGIMFMILDNKNPSEKINKIVFDEVYSKHKE